MDNSPLVSRILLLTLLGSWLVAAAAVWGWGVKYGFTTYAAPAQALCQAWPAGTILELDASRPTLLLFFHPRCPCTRATLAELEKVVFDRRVTGGAAPRIVAMATIPRGENQDWSDAGLVSRIEQLPNTQLYWDEQGVEAARFGAVSSGTVMLFDSSGDKLFAGGITSSRGHEGDNAGRDQLMVALMQKSNTNPRSTPVFGCRLCLPVVITELSESCGEGSCPPLLQGGPTR